MNTHQPPAALALLFPELPEWALAPFLGRESVTVPFPHDEHIHIRAGTEAPNQWESNISRIWRPRMHAGWYFERHLCPIPFGMHTEMLLTNDPGREDRMHWVPVNADLLATWGEAQADFTPAHNDILRRWQAIADPLAQQELMNFWLGHDIPAMAALGLATLRLATHHETRTVPR
jgi:hypothetical protein